MNLLLLLSALLSALTGVSGPARAQAPQMLSQSLAVAQDCAATAARPVRPGQPLAGLAMTALAPVMRTMASLPTVATLLTNRRRE